MELSVSVPVDKGLAEELNELLGKPIIVRKNKRTIEVVGGDWEDLMVLNSLCKVVLELK